MHPVLGSISPEVFLRDYWQKKPLLIRQAFAGFKPPLSIDELAGLALEEMVESRLVMEEGTNEQGEIQPWQLFNGPFTEEFLQKLPKEKWTLLVQAVDHYLPEVEAIKEEFNFLPSWRLDDVMISYAPTGGSVGPHFDYYDVFLLQASGTRRWQLGGFCDENTPVRSDTQLKILEDFEVKNGQDWVLEPGDLLYLPPGLAHWGVATSHDCTTWSIGYRAPSAEEVVSGVTDFIASQLNDGQRYADPNLVLPSHPAEITSASLGLVQELLTATLNQPQLIQEWFGRAVTQTKYLDQLLPPEDPWQEADLANLLFTANDTDELLSLAEGSRVAFSQTAAGVWLFVDGEAWQLEAAYLAWVEELAASKYLTASFIKTSLEQPLTSEILLTLINSGSFYFIDEE